MRKLILFSTGLLFLAIVTGQELKLESHLLNAFDADSTVWNEYNKVRVSMNGEFLYDTIYINRITMYGDTIIDGMKWKRIDFKGDRSFQFQKNLIRTDGQKIYLKNHISSHTYTGYSKEVLIYDFNAEKGDTIRKGNYFVDYGHSTPSEPDYFCVMGNDSVEINQVKRKRYYMIEDPGMTYGYWCVEGIGNITGLFSHLTLKVVPTFSVLENNEEYPVLKNSHVINCIADGKVLYYNHEFSDENGNILVSNENVNEISEKTKVLYANGQLHISHTDGALFHVSIYNMQGILVLQQKNIRHETMISLSNIATGVYSVSVVSDSPAVYTQKIVKLK